MRRLEFFIFVQLLHLNRILIRFSVVRHVGSQGAGTSIGCLGLKRRQRGIPQSSDRKTSGVATDAGFEAIGVSRKKGSDKATKEIEFG